MKQGTQWNYASELLPIDLPYDQVTKMSAENESQTSVKNESQPIKIVVIGDRTTGRTCLLVTYSTGQFPSGYIPATYEGYVSCSSEAENNISIVDIGAVQGYDRLWPLTYFETNAFLVCFSVDNRNSFENVKHKWLPQVRHYCGLDVPIILVGTKIDLRGDSDVIAKLEEKNLPMVSYEEGIALVKSQKILTYLECSALTSTGCHDVIKAAVEAGKNFKPSPPSQAKRKCCCALI